MIQKNIPFALILEDDISFDQELINFLEHFNSLNYKPEILLLGYHSANSRVIYDIDSIHKEQVSETRTIEEAKEKAYGTYGYIISLPRAITLYNISNEFILPIDHYTGSPELNPIHIIKPPLVDIYEELSNDSTIAQEREIIHKKFRQKEKRLQSYMEEFSKIIDNLNQKIILYGYGDLGIALYEKYPNKIEIVVDNSKHNTFINDDKKILSHNEVNYNTDKTILISVLNKNTVKEIINNIQNKNSSIKIISILNTP